jgi:hypothetical protein
VSGSSDANVTVQTIAKKRKELTLFEGHRNSTLLDDVTLSAMYQCGLVAGPGDHETAYDLAQAIRNNTLHVWPTIWPNREDIVDVAMNRVSYRVVLSTYGLARTASESGDMQPVNYSLALTCRACPTAPPSYFFDVSNPSYGPLAQGGKACRRDLL